MSPSPPLRHLRSLLASALLLALGACTLLPESEPMHVHVLPAFPSEWSPPPPLDATLRVETPAASASLSGNRILVMPGDNRLSVYQGARWSDPTPQLVRDRLIEAFQQIGGFTAVFDENSRLPADMALASDLRAFHSVYTNDRPEAVIRLDVRLVDESDGRLVASRRFEQREPSEATDVEAVVAAFGRAADALSRKLVAWSHELVSER